jgi:hypothetical protein
LQVAFVGDHAYDFDAQGSHVGNAYMNDIQPIAANKVRAPWAPRGEGAGPTKGADSRRVLH